MEFNNLKSNRNNFFEVQNCLIIPIQLDLYDEFLTQLRNDILDWLNDHATLGVIIDLSYVSIIDSFNLQSLIKTCDMIRLMGREIVIIGFQAGVASALTELPNLELNKLITFINLNAAIKYLKEIKANQ